MLGQVRLRLLAAHQRLALATAFLGYEEEDGDIPTVIEVNRAGECLRQWHVGRGRCRHSPAASSLSLQNKLIEEDESNAIAPPLARCQLDVARDADTVEMMGDLLKRLAPQRLEPLLDSWVLPPLARPPPARPIARRREWLRGGGCCVNPPVGTAVAQEAVATPRRKWERRAKINMTSDDKAGNRMRLDLPPPIAALFEAKLQERRRKGEAGGEWELVCAVLAELGPRIVELSKASAGV